MFLRGKAKWPGVGRAFLLFEPFLLRGGVGVQKLALYGGNAELLNQAAGHFPFPYAPRRAEALIS